MKVMGSEGPWAKAPSRYWITNPYLDHAIHARPISNDCLASVSYAYYTVAPTASDTLGVPE